MARTGTTLIKIQNGGVAVPGSFSTINLGTGLAGTDLGNGVIEFDSSGGGGSISFETPSGTVDGTNTTFTVTVAPLYIVTDGVQYFENIPAASPEYTRSGLTITTKVPPTEFIRSAHS